MPDCALILAAGSGRRMGADLPKALLPLGPPPAPTFLGRTLALLAPVVERVFVVVQACEEAAFRGHAGPGAASRSAQCGDGRGHPVEFVPVPPTVPGCDRPGSTTSLVQGFAAVERWRPGGAATLVMDADLVFERALLDGVVARCDRSRLFSVDRVSGDSEEVRVYGLPGGEPRLLGKGLPPEVTGGLTGLGESLGVIHLQRDEQVLAAAVAAWLAGTPPDFAGRSYAGARSEHEEVWQYLFALGRLACGLLPGDLLFSECDFAEDYAHVTGELYPAIVARDRGGAA